MNKHTGFTFSEVLITLTLIGFVAALTVPFVYGNYIEGERSARVKNFSKIMNNALEDAFIENDERSFFGTAQDEDRYYLTNITNIMNHLRPHLPITEECGLETGGNCSFHGKYKPFSKKGTTYQHSFDTNLYYKFNLSDGSHVYFFIGRIAYSDLIYPTGYEIIYDMNGDKGPNRFGYDTFVFEITPKLKMLPFGTSSNNKYNDCENDSWGSGFTCSAKIMNNIKY